MDDKGSLTSAFAWVGFLALIGIGILVSRLGVPTWLAIVITLLVFSVVISLVSAAQRWLNKH